MNLPNRQELPNGWDPRIYQLPLWRYLEDGGLRAHCIWHRRAGKDDVALHWTAVSMAEQPGVYWHLLPEAAQARKAIWTAVDPHTGVRRIDQAFPPWFRRKTRDQEMFIETTTGSVWQVLGSDNYNSLVGSPPRGVVLSEWALADPACWQYLRPILAENGGWALFITTPRGRNHAFRFHQAAQNNPDWFAEILTANDTDVFSDAALKAEHAELTEQYGQELGDAIFAQEYLCAFDSPIAGAYYATELQQARREHRITTVPYSDDLPVQTAWDLGINDETAIWFVQRAGRECRVIAYEHYRDRSLQDIWRDVDSKGWTYSQHILPHDARVREMTTGRMRMEVLQSLGMRNIDIAPRLPPIEQVTAGRVLMRRAVFDETMCEDGLAALAAYHRIFDEKLNTYRDQPVHDWASHGASAWGYLALMWSEKPAYGDPGYRMPRVKRSLGGGRR